METADEIGTEPTRSGQINASQMEKSSVNISLILQLSGIAVDTYWHVSPHLNVYACLDKPCMNLHLLVMR